MRHLLQQKVQGEGEKQLVCGQVCHGHNGGSNSRGSSGSSVGHLLLSP